MSTAALKTEKARVKRARKQSTRQKRKRRSLQKTSILSRGKLVDVLTTHPGSDQRDHDGATGGAVTRLGSKHVDSVVQQFIEFERRHFWNRRHGLRVSGLPLTDGERFANGPDLAAPHAAGGARRGVTPTGPGSWPVPVPADSGRTGGGGGGDDDDDAGTVVPQFDVFTAGHGRRSSRDVPRRLKEAIAVHCPSGGLTTRVAHAEPSSDGATIKLLIELQDGYQVESVIMRHRHHSAGGGNITTTRATLCVSSQVGCKMGCKFCATGTLGELGNLTSGEILEQLVWANRINDVPMRNVVFMGMGEPLNNYNSVVEAVRVMTSQRGFGLAASRVTVSTVGIAPRMEQLVTDLPHVSMALSLHAPTQEMRASIVPAARGWKMERLMGALDAHTRITGRAALVQYILCLLYTSPSPRDRG